MIGLRLAVPAVFVATAVAAGITYFVAPTPPQPVEANQGLPPTVPHAAQPDPGISRIFNGQMLKTT